MSLLAYPIFPTPTITQKYPFSILGRITMRNCSTVARATHNMSTKREATLQKRSNWMSPTLTVFPWTSRISKIGYNNKFALAIITMHSTHKKHNTLMHKVSTICISKIIRTINTLKAHHLHIVLAIVPTTRPRPFLVVLPPLNALRTSTHDATPVCQTLCTQIQCTSLLMLKTALRQYVKIHLHIWIRRIQFIPTI